MQQRARIQIRIPKHTMTLTEFTHAQYRLLGITQCVLGAISMGGCAVIIASFARFRSCLL